MYSIDIQCILDVLIYRFTHNTNNEQTKTHTNRHEQTKYKQRRTRRETKRRPRETRGSRTPYMHARVY